MRLLSCANCFCWLAWILAHNVLHSFCKFYEELKFSKKTETIALVFTLLTDFFLALSTFKMQVASLAKVILRWWFAPVDGAAFRLHDVTGASSLTSSTAGGASDWLLPLLFPIAFKPIEPISIVLSKLKTCLIIEVFYVSMWNTSCGAWGINHSTGLQNVRLQSLKELHPVHCILYSKGPQSWKRSCLFY